MTEMIESWRIQPAPIEAVETLVQAITPMVTNTMNVIRVSEYEYDS